MTQQQTLYTRRQVLGMVGVAAVSGGLAAHFGPRVYNSAIDLIVPDPIASLERKVAAYARESPSTGEYVRLVIEDLGGVRKLRLEGGITGALADFIKDDRVEITAKKDYTDYPFLRLVEFRETHPGLTAEKSITHSFNNESEGKVPFFSAPSNKYNEWRTIELVGGKAGGLGYNAYVARLFLDVLKDALQYNGQSIGSDSLPQLEMRVAMIAKNLGGGPSIVYRKGKDGKDKRIYKQEIDLQSGQTSKRIEINAVENSGTLVLDEVAIFIDEPHKGKYTAYFFDKGNHPELPFLKGPDSKLSVSTTTKIGYLTKEEIQDKKEKFGEILSRAINFKRDKTQK